MEPQYAVVAFPALVGADSVEAVRRRLDPLAALLAAHITLVFPFRADLSEASLADHVGRAVEGVPPFAVALTGLSVETGGYLFLNVGAGAERFHALHARLYSGPLACHRSSAHEYRPHVTVGRVADHHGLAEARQEAYLALRLPVLGTVPGLAIFRLDGPDRGAVVCKVPFAA
jgi:2'-5' RNA ligase